MKDFEFWFIYDNIEKAFQKWEISFEKRLALQMRLISYYNRTRFIK